MRRQAVIVAAAILATTPGAAAWAQEAAPPAQPVYELGQAPPDMPPEDGARMAQLELQATAALDAGDWPLVERLLREGLVLEQRHYRPDDARIGHSWGWLVRAAREQGQAPATIIPMAETRLRIAEAHPEDAVTLSEALQILSDLYMAVDRAAEALPLLVRAEALLDGRDEQALWPVRTRRGMALAATGDKAAAADLLSGVLSHLQADPAADPGDLAYVAWEAAVALFDTGRFAEAAPAFEAVMRHRAANGLSRDEAAAGYWLAQTLIRMERTDAADAVLERVVALDTAATPDQRALTLEQMRDAVIQHGDRMREAGRLDAAEAAYRLAVRVNREETAPGVYLASPLSRLGLILQAKDQHDEAVAVQREALALWREARGDRHGDVATQYEQLGRTLLMQHNLTESLRAFGDAAAIRGALGQEISLGVLQDHAEIAEESGLLQTARQRREEIVARLRAETPVRPDVLADNLMSLGHVLYLLDDLAGSERLYREAQPLTQRPVLQDRIRTGLAMTLTAQGRGGEGEPIQRQVVTDVAQRAGPTSPEAAVALIDLGHILARRGDRQRAEAVLLDAQAILENQPEPDRARLATLKMNLGVTVSDMGRHEEALRLLVEAFRIRSELYGKGHARTVAVIELILFEYVELGAYDLAEPMAAQLARIRQDQFGSDHPILAEALQRQAYLLQHAGRPREAERLMRRAAGIIDRHSQDPRKRIRYNANWGVTLLTSDRPVEALEVFRRAEAGLIERRNATVDPAWSRNEAASFRFLHRFAVQAAWAAANPASGEDRQSPTVAPAP